MPFNAIQFCRDNAIQYWTEGKNVQRGWINIRCPLCEDSSNHGGINPSRAYYHCWKCGGHFLYYVISRLLGISKEESQKILFEYSSRGVALSHLNKKEIERPQSIEMPGEELLPMHRKYLIKRGFDPDFLVEKYGIKGTGIAGDWKFRIMIPIFFQGRLVCYQGRDITDKQEHRYKTLAIEKSIMPAKKLLYNIDNCKKDFCVLTEGVTNVWRFGDNFCASFGTGMKEEQIKLLCGFKKVFFLFDPEKEAQQLARKNAIKLSSFGVETELIDLDDGRDPADHSYKEAEKIKKIILKGRI